MGRELIELAALFIATGVADLFVSTLSHNRVGPVVLFALGGLLIATVAWRRWAHRPRPEPARGTGGVHPPETGTAWRIRATVRDVPGSLAGVTAALAAHRYDIVSLQVLAVPDGVVDEFLVRTRESVRAADIAEVTELGGGRDVRVVPADVHEFVDLPTRLLTIAAQAAEPEAGLAQLLRAVLGECAVERTSPGGRTGKATADGIGTTTMRLADPDGDVVVTRPLLPFTPPELARARAVLDLHRRLAGTAAPESDVEVPRQGHGLGA